MRKIAVLPTLMTLGNAVCGFAALMCVSRINSSATDEYYFALSGWLIMAAMVFDALDGYVARLSRTTSKFGAELDSLCDAISFGVAPAFLLLRLGPGWEPRPILAQLVIGIAVLYMSCAVLRLARYNIEASADGGASKKFRGLPSPGAAGCLASLAILRGELPAKIHLIWPQMEMDNLRSFTQWLIEIWAPVGALAVALLMVSRLPYPHLTKQMLRGRKHLSHLIQLLLLAVVFLAFRETVLAVIFWGYGLGLAVRYAVVRGWRSAELPAPALDEGLPQ